MADYFAELGFEIDRFTCLGFTDDREMARIAPDEIAALAPDATAPGSDALFISCTALRAAQVAGRIERKIGKPVVSSNLATAWACLRLCGEDQAWPEVARLMTMPYPDN
jgi:maleate isomerase